MTGTSRTDLGEVVVVDAEGGPDLAIVEGEGRAHAVIWPGMGASRRSLHKITLDPGSRTTELHHLSDCVYYVISGAGCAIDCDTRGEQPLVTGSMVHIDAGTSYRLSAGEESIEIVGGPSPADPGLYHLAANQGGE